MIPRYAPDGDGRALLRRGPVRHVAAGRAAGHRGLGRGRGRARRRRRGLPGPGPEVDAAFVAAVAERERVTDHDVAAFVDVVQEAIGQPEGSWIHYGLTSSDVVDTALCATLTRAADLLIEAAAELVAGAQGPGARVHRRRRSPGGPTACTPSRPPSGPSSPCGPCRPTGTVQRLRAARDRVAVGKLSGAVGTYSNIDPRVEDHVVPGPRARPRRRPPRWWPGTATPSTSGPAPRWGPPSSSSPPRSATWPAASWARRRSRSSRARRGARPCPTSATRSCRSGCAAWPGCCGATSSAGLEDVALWHERDISHSSVERVVLPDASMLTLYMLQKATGLVEGLVLHPERALATLTEGSHGLVFSQSVLLALVSGGPEPRRRLPHRPARRPGGVGRGPAVPPGPRRGPRGHPVARGARRGLRPVPYPAPCPPIHRCPGGARPMTTRRPVNRSPCSSPARSGSSTTPATAGC